MSVKEGERILRYSWPVWRTGVKNTFKKESCELEDERKPVERKAPCFVQASRWLSPSISDLLKNGETENDPSHLSSCRGTELCLLKLFLLPQPKQSASVFSVSFCKKRGENVRNWNTCASVRHFTMLSRYLQFPYQVSQTEYHCLIVA